MPFLAFHGNQETVTGLRQMLARDRFPQAVILSGPAGAGKYTLAQMLAKAANCERAPLTADLPDFCGQCSNCVRIGEADDLEARFAEAVEARDSLRDTDKRETRILIRSHPDVMVIPPDPPQMLVKVDQIRKLIETIYYRPVEAPRRIFIFSNASFMKEAANSVLKVLEEPPEFATLFLLTTNPSELLPTIRSRCIHLRLSPLPQAEIERDLAMQRKDVKPAQRSMIARLSGGAVGRARSFDLNAYEVARTDALILLKTGIDGNDHSSLFRATETYRAGAEGKEKTDTLLRTTYLLLEDLLFLKSGTPEMVRNLDIQAELSRLSAAIDFDWIVNASGRIADVERGMRRNLLRSVSLDAFALALERP